MWFWFVYWGAVVALFVAGMGAGCAIAGGVQASSAARHAASARSSAGRAAAAEARAGVAAATAEAGLESSVVVADVTSWPMLHGPRIARLDALSPAQLLDVAIFASGIAPAAVDRALEMLETGPA